ncbi:MAG: glutamate--cysteine ligase [Rhodospirillaceae bacterium]|nr:glutamate--cysteine ligase [Rhodospirillaceae bacterium]
MFDTSQKKLTRLINGGFSDCLIDGLKGIEKESLRVTPDGWISQAPHPKSLGAALTHPYITTDYSEALLEFITPPFSDTKQTLRFLSDIHRFVYDRLGTELLWATSMPCRVGDDDTIPIANYGTSNVGQMKSVYRRGLRNRYGSIMQTISGIHFNYSFPEKFWNSWSYIQYGSFGRDRLVSDAYFRLIRNFQRYGWLLSYLFGTSPAVCKTFLPKEVDGFDEFDNGTWYQSHATSLRMSDIGYKNKNQAALNVTYNNINEYVRSLTRAIETPSSDYDAIGLLDDEGGYRQLNTNFLQIENEFYSFIRPKQIANSGEKPTLALKRRGVGYVEIRALDVGAFDVVGCNEAQLRFVETFLAFCLFEDSPPVSKFEVEQIEYNQSVVACCGRDPALELTIGYKKRKVRDWVQIICDSLDGFAELLDINEVQKPYCMALEQQKNILRDSERLPSTRLMEDMSSNNESFFDFAMRKSAEHQIYFQDGYAITKDREREFELEVEKSLQNQKDMERSDDVSFPDYLKRYFSQR